MRELNNSILLIITMVCISVIVVGTASLMLYRTAVDEEKHRLVETAQSQARLIEAIARNEAEEHEDSPEIAEKAALSQVIDAHMNYQGFGETGEFTLARRVGDNIIFLLRHRHTDLEFPKPIPFESELAEPMRLALSGVSGTVIGLDYRGEKVLAAYEPVGELNLGIVAKIDFVEIQSPFIGAGLITLVIASFVNVLGAWLFFRITNPMVRKLEKSEERLSRFMESATDGFILFDSELNYIDINKSALEMTGMDRTTFIGKNILDVVPDIKKSGRYDDYKEVIKTGEPLHYSDIMLHPKFGMKYTGVKAFKVGDGLGMIFTDITEKKKADEEFKNIFNLSPDMLGVFTTEGKLLKVNPAWKKVLGYSTKELLDMDWPKLVHPDDVEKTNKTVEKQLKGSSVVNFVNRYKCKDGSYKTLEWQATFAIEGIVYASARDITERKQTEENLRASEERFRVALKNSQITVFTQDRDLRFTWAYNPTPGFDMDMILGKTDEDLVGAEHAAKTIAIKRRVLETGKSMREELSAIADGKTLYYDLACEPLYDDKGEIAGIVCASIDITERKKSDEALRLLITNSLDVIFRIELDKGYTYMSPSVEKLLGYHPEDYYNDSEFWRKITFADDISKVDEMFAAILVGKEPPNMWELRQFDKDRNLIHIEFTSVAIRNEAGKIVALEGVARDITERKQTELELEKHREHLEELVKERTEELEKNNAELERLNKLFVGREFRIKELKDRVKELEGK